MVTYRQYSGYIKINIGDVNERDKENTKKLVVRISHTDRLPEFLRLTNFVLPDTIDLENSYERAGTGTNLFNDFPDVPPYEMNGERWYVFQIFARETAIQAVISNLSRPYPNLQISRRGRCRSVWFPTQHSTFGADISGTLHSRHNIYVISLGRFDYMDTSLALEQMNQPHIVVCEPFEYEHYYNAMKNKKWGSVLSCGTDFHLLKDGSKHVRNWVHRREMKKGSTHYWLLDDNMSGFYRHHLNQLCRVKDGSCFYYIENLQGHLNNVGICGMSYKSDVPAIDKKRSHLQENSKVYSAFLIDIKNTRPLLDSVNNLFRGKYNEDIILCIDSLKKKIPTFTTCQYLCDKQSTGTRSGGNQRDIYIRNGEGVWDSKVKTDYLMNTFRDLTEDGLIQYRNRRGKKYHHYVDWKGIEIRYNVPSLR